MVDFRTLVETLEAHPDIWVARAQFQPGASQEEIARAEAQLGVPLNREIKAFYTHHNGLAIEWMFKQSDRFQNATYEVNTSEVPFWMDLMEDYGPPFDGQIIVAPIGEVFVESYEAIENPSNFDPSVAYMEFIEYPEEKKEGRLAFADLLFESQEAFRAKLRLFDHFLRDYGNLMLFQPGKSDPDLFHCEEHWHNMNEKLVLPVSLYLHQVAHDFGLRWHRGQYFQGAEAAPVEFDPAARLTELIAETKFPGDLR